MEKRLRNQFGSEKPLVPHLCFIYGLALVLIIGSIFVAIKGGPGSNYSIFINAFFVASYAIYIYIAGLSGFMAVSGF